MQNHPTPGQLLGEELLKRRLSQPRYSLRTFADDIGLSSAFLSRILKDQRDLSLGKATALVKRLNWPADKRTLFLKLVRRQESQDSAEWHEIDQEIATWVHHHPDYHPLQLDAVALTSRWYHYAIFELVSLPNFTADPRWIAKRLGILPLEASLALERLKRVGMLQFINSRWVQSSPNFDTGNVPSQIIRKYHLQMLQLASDAVEEQNPEDRFLRTVTLAVDPSRLEEANLKITQFQRDLTEFLNGGNLQAVYQLSVQLFRLDRRD